MKLIKDIFFIKADKDANKRIKLSTGDSLYVDTDFNKYAYATKTGKITHAPRYVNDRWEYDIKLKNGDQVLFHQFVCQNENQVNINGKTYFKADYHHLFAIITKEELKPLENFIFVDPIEETEEDKFDGKLQVKFETGNIKGSGIIKYLSNQALEAGLKVGDKVHYTKNAEYKMQALGKMFYRMRIRNIILIEREGELICMNNKVLMKEEPVKEEFLVINQRESMGRIVKVGANITDVSVGDKVGYFRGITTAMSHKGESYLSIRKENINYIL